MVLDFENQLDKSKNLIFLTKNNNFSQFFASFFLFYLNNYTPTTPLDLIRGSFDLLWAHLVEWKNSTLFVSVLTFYVYENWLKAIENGQNLMKWLFN